VEALRAKKKRKDRMKLSLSILREKKERQDETQFTNLGGKKEKTG
jgi:hypothetical protein